LEPDESLVDRLLTSTTQCTICGRPFCINHAASLDIYTCGDCLNEKAAEIKEAPLVNSDGVEQEGRLITPVGPYYVSRAGSVVNMSDQELERFANQYTMKVHECERALEYNRIMGTMIEGERDDRRRSNLRKMRTGSPLSFAGKIKVGEAKAASKTANPAAAMAAKLKAAGFTLEMLQAMMPAQAPKEAKKE
jgi:hypothetical protein